MQASMALAAGVAPARGVAGSSASVSSRCLAPVAAPLRLPAVSARASRAALVVRAGGLNDIPGFGSGLTPNVKIKGGMGGSKSIKPEDVVLESECGADYEPLKEALAAGEFEKADDITRALLIEIAGEGAQERGWVYFTEIKTISVADMKTMDNLWRAYSDGKFGFSVQKTLWTQVAKRWPKFFKRIDWVVGENNNYRKWPAEFFYTKDAAKGHLPLTNALRGTELIQAIFEHPAFEQQKKERPKVGAGGFDSTAL